MKINKELAFINAQKFLEKKYPELKSNEEWVNFDNVYWSKYGTRSRASRHGFADKYGLKPGLAIRISIKPSRKKKWDSYHKKTPLGWICPIGGIDVKPQVGLEITLVHELTHIIQYLFVLPVGELLTTVNEQEYVLENYPYYSKFLVTYEARKFQELLFKRSKKKRAKFEQVNGKWTYVSPS